MGSKTNVWKRELKQEAVEKNDVVKTVEQKMRFAATFYCLHKSEDAEQCDPYEMEAGNQFCCEGLENLPKSQGV